MQLSGRLPAFPRRPAPEHPALWRGSSLARVALPGTSTGFPLLDQELPGGGWPAAGLTEMLPAHEGIGELRLLGPALAGLSSQGKRLAWIAPPHLPYAPALAAANIVLNHLLIVRTRTAEETLWAAEQALRSGACGAVLLWSATRDHTVLRRLQLAAENGHALAFLFRPPGTDSQATPVALRLRLRLESAAGGLAVHILKRRGMPLHHPVFIPSTAAADRNVAGPLHNVVNTSRSRGPAPISNPTFAA